MGEYADEYIDRMIGEEPWGSRQRRRFVAREVTCKKCGKSGLRWHQRSDGTFKLVDPNADKGKRLRKHKCEAVNPRAANDFDDLDKTPEPLTKEQIAALVYATANGKPYFLPLQELYRHWGNARGGGMLDNALARFVDELARPDIEIKTHWERPHQTVRVIVEPVYDLSDEV